MPPPRTPPRPDSRRSPGRATPRAVLGSVAALVLATLSGSHLAVAAPSPAADPKPFLDASGPALFGASVDGKVLLVRRLEHGVAQAYRTGPRGEAPVKVTKRAEAVDFAVLSPDGSKAVVGYDRDGDEDAGLYLVDVVGPTAGTERTLSAQPGVQHGSVRWAREGDRVYYRSNADTRADFHLYCLPLAGGEPHRVLAEPGSWHVEDVAPGGARLLVSLRRSNADATLYLLDLATGKRTAVDPLPEGVRADLSGARFLGTGERVLYVSDRGGEHAWPRVVDLSTGASRTIPIHGEGTARGVRALPDVDEAAATPDGRTVFVAENSGGWTFLSAVDVATGEETHSVAVTDEHGVCHLGVARGLQATEQGDLCFTWSTPNEPPSVIRWIAATEASPVVAAPDLAGLARDRLPEMPDGVRYPTFDGREIPAWLWRPRGDAKAPRPTVLRIHGGPEGQERPVFTSEIAFLLDLGFVVFAPNVRGSTGYGRSYAALDDYRGRPGAVKDWKAAADWLVKEGVADPRRLAVTGGSYGGYGVLACLTEYPTTFAAGVDVVGIANFETFLERTASYRRALREAEYGPLTDREFLRSISPIHRVDRIVAPLYLAHGARDPRVPIGEARQMEAAIRARGGDVETLYYEDEGHGFAKPEHRREHLTRLGAFLERTIGSAGKPTVAGTPDSR